MASYGSVNTSTASWIKNLDNILPGQSGRVEFSREHYEHFRPSEAIPKKYSDVIRAIDEVYASVSIVRNVIDLMSDFACEGIEIVHPVKSVEKFYKEWFEKVNGVDRSERLLSGLYRHGMVAVRQYNADVQYKGLENKVTMSATEDFRGELPEMNITPNNIPIKYFFHNPAYFTHENYHEINAEPVYKIKKPTKIYSDNLLGTGNHNYYSGDEIIIPTDRLTVIYFKKDDWLAKPIPMLYPIIKHAMMLEKLNLADAAALDGAISKVRIFKLGNVEKDIYPEAGAAEFLDQVLRSSSPGGTTDIIWDDAIDLLESNTDVYKFLGEQKYVPHLSQIYEGLGIPASFVGSGQGTTNNYISLKIMTRRLMYGRDRLVRFWKQQIKEVQKAMGFNQPAHLEFNNLDLGDEESERQLLIQLLDRDIISSERLQKILGFDPRMENKRINREYRERKSNRRADKSSQFHQPEKDFVYKKAALERGYWAPENVGIEKTPGTEDMPTPQEVRFIERNKAGQKPGTKEDRDNEAKKGAGGRPPGSKDTQPRKSRTFKPVSKAGLDIWLNRTQQTINKELREPLLNSVGCANFREVTAQDFENFEKIKFAVLLNIEPMQEVGISEIVNLLGQPMPSTCKQMYLELHDELTQALKRNLTLDENHILQQNVYKEFYKDQIDVN